MAMNIADSNELTRLIIITFLQTNPFFGQQ